MRKRLRIPAIMIGRKILIADENPATLDFLSRLLQDRGFQIFTAESGEQVIEVLRKQRWFNAILIGDLTKPPIDGLDLLRRLRSHAASIVVATSFGADYMLLARMAGAQTVIHKFGDPGYLIATVEKVLRPESLFM